MKTRLTESPDLLSYSGIKLDSSSPNASTFMVIDDDTLVYSYAVTHPMIFNTLRKSTDATHATQKLKDDVKAVVYPKLTDKKLDYYKSEWVGIMGQLRQKMQAGRMWEDVEIAGKKTTVISFWSKKSDSKTAIKLLKRAHNLKGTIVVEYMDSEIPEILGKTKSKIKKIKSDIHTDLSEEDIINILVKAHTSGYKNLTDKEKDVVDEFRGTTSWKVTKYAGRWGDVTPAEWNFYKTIGDGKQPSAGYLVEVCHMIDKKLDVDAA